MENKQTAVEWLIEQLEGDDSKIARVIGLKKYNSIIEQSKQMEKDQIKESWNDGNLLGRNGHILLEYNTGEQYYNETYES